MAALTRTEALRRSKTAVAEYDGVAYRRVTDDQGEVPRGTVLVGGQIIYGYPRIGRILALGTGLVEQFHGALWAEEKVDGYNVRIFRHGERLLALTRGGYICPFTTDRLEDLLDTTVFEHEPDLVLCAEVAGPDNPYMHSTLPDVQHDVRLFVFDVMRKDSPQMTQVGATRGCVERYGLPPVPIYGRFWPSDVDALRALLLDINEQGREGLVFKGEGPSAPRAKYVSGNSNLSDIAGTTIHMRDLPPEYYTNRLLRLALFVHEQGIEHSEELDRRLGAAFLQGVMDSIRQFEQTHKVFRTVRCRFRHRHNAERMLEHLKQVSAHQLHVHCRRLVQEPGYWLLEFDRIYPSTSGTLNHILRGGMVFD